MTPAVRRLVLFVDYQNVYRGARDAFFPPNAFHTCGQVNPLALGQCVAARMITRVPRQLQQVRIYTGRPSSTKDPRGYGAHMRQCSTWEKFPGVKVIPRTLRYPRDYPNSKEEEKGIDVALAVDFVMMKLRGEYDVGVIFSTDTDLLPALEAVCELTKQPGEELPEVCAWGQERQGRSRLRVQGFEIRCHWLDRGAFDSIADRTDYNIRPRQ